MSMIDLVSKMFVEGIIIPAHTDKQGANCIDIKENSPGAKLRQVTIRNLPAASKAIKLDEFVPKHGLLSGKKGELSRCDYLLFVNENNQDYIYFIELKSTKPGTRPKVQFKASLCLVCYFGLLAKTFYAEIPLESTPQKRFVLFYKGNIAKRSTAYKPVSWENNTCEKYYSRSLPKQHQYIDYKELR